MLNADTNPLAPPTVDGGVCSLSLLLPFVVPLFFIVPFFCVLLLFILFLVFFVPGVAERALAKRLNSNLSLSSALPLIFPGLVVFVVVGPFDGSIPIIIIPRSSFPRPVFGTAAAALGVFAFAGPLSLAANCCCCLSNASIFACNCFAFFSASSSSSSE